MFLEATIKFLLGDGKADESPCEKTLGWTHKWEYMQVVEGNMINTMYNLFIYCKFVCVCVC